MVFHLLDNRPGLSGCKHQEIALEQRGPQIFALLRDMHFGLATNTELFVRNALPLHLLFIRCHHRLVIFTRTRTRIIQRFKLILHLPHHLAVWNQLFPYRNTATALVSSCWSQLRGGVTLNRCP
ncbi:hypothetical protein PC118_g6065 [Phytophthora cactorum]|uniref:Uncharacterized protein n=1 Tax=Phytophthora cactorum TaxID=29920 RepID=A0A8T1G6B4_9STRA|nr:hypothetical protein PC118_g6065 [Phytophthora cactorum]